MGRHPVNHSLESRTQTHSPTRDPLGLRPALSAAYRLCPKIAVHGRSFIAACSCEPGGVAQVDAEPVGNGVGRVEAMTHLSGRLEGVGEGVERMIFRAVCRVLTVTVPLLVVPVGVGSSTAMPAVGPTVVTMFSEPGDYIGEGENRLFRDGPNAITVSGSVDDVVTVDIDGGLGTDGFSLSFAAVEGESLVAGFYGNAEDTPFRTPGHPGIDISGDHRGCNHVIGRFTVLDISPDLSRLWLVYEQHCEGTDPALFGEVRYGMPDTGNEIVSPSRVVWPDQFPGTSAHDVPVTVVNTAQESLNIDDVDLVGDVDSFSVISSDCDVLAPGASCTVAVRLSPQSLGSHEATLELWDTVSAVRSVELSGRGLDGRTAWTMYSESADPMGEGADYRYTRDNATISATGDAHGFHLTVDSGQEQWSARFDPADGESLVQGVTYEVEREFGHDFGYAVMEVATNGRECEHPMGWFVIDHVRYGESGAVEQLGVRFDQRCDRAAGALFGTIEWRVDDGAQQFREDVYPPRSVWNVQADAGVSDVQLEWGSNSLYTVVRLADGTVPPVSIEDGVAAYKGRATRTSVEKLEIGADYSLSFFCVDPVGKVSESTFLILRRSRIAVEATPRVTYGHKVDITGTVIGNGSVPVADGDLSILAGPPGGGPLELIHQMRTDENGRFTLRTEPSENLRFRVRFEGSGFELGALSASVRTNVAPAVTLSADRRTTAGGDRFKLSTAVSPNHAGDEVVLQRYRGGDWRRVETSTLSPESATTFELSLTRSRERFRVRKPGDGDHVAAVSQPITLHVDD